MTHVRVLWSFPWEENHRASTGRIKQSITCENTKMHGWMFNECMYEYMTRLPWEFVRMIHGIGNHVIRRLRCFTRLDGLTSMAKVEWGIRVAQPNFWPVKVLIKPVRSLKHQIQGSKNRLVDVKCGKNMMNMPSRKWVKRDWRYFQCGNRIAGWRRQIHVRVDSQLRK